MELEGHSSAKEEDTTTIGQRRIKCEWMRHRSETKPCQPPSQKPPSTQNFDRETKLTISLEPQLTFHSHRYSESDHKDVRFYKVDVDEVPDVAKELGIRAMPTFVLFKNGSEVETIVGANPKAIEAALAKHKA
jgi:thiol-disulfide isomerase/thioredoxin